MSERDDNSEGYFINNNQQEIGSDNILDNLDDFPPTFNDALGHPIRPVGNEDNIDLNYEIQIPSNDEMADVDMIWFDANPDGKFGKPGYSIGFDRSIGDERTEFQPGFQNIGSLAFNKNHSSVKSEENIKLKMIDDIPIEEGKANIKEEAREKQRKSKRSNTNKSAVKEEQSKYGLRKRDPMSNMSEHELARRSIVQYPNEQGEGYAMLTTENENFIMNRPVCLIGRKCKSSNNDTWFLELQNSFHRSTNGISKVAARVFFSPKIKEFWIENVGKNTILVDYKPLKKAGSGSVAFRVLRNEACIQISSHTIFFTLPKEVLYQKKILRESRKALLFDKISKLSKKTVTGTKDEQIAAIKEYSNDIYSEAPKLSLKDLILLYKHKEGDLDLPNSLKDKYFISGMKSKED